MNPLFVADFTFPSAYGLYSWNVINAFNRIAKSKTINPYNYYTTTTRSNAKAKNLEHNLTPEFLEYLFKKQNCKCSVSNIDIHLRTSKSICDKSLFQASIDRIDNSKGYIIENVHFVALGINYMRNTVDLDEVKNFIYSIKNSEPTEVLSSTL